MKCLLLLACLGVTLSVTSAVKTRCPPRKYSSLKPSPNDDCDVCEELKNEDSDFHQNCGKHLDQILIWKIVKDCNRLWNMMDSENKKSHLHYFWDNLNLLCHAKHLDKFDPPRCECDPCDELGMISSDFMQHCAPHLHPYQIQNIIGKCHALKHDYGQLWKFFEYLRVYCKELGGVSIKTPMCECDVCWLLTEENSDFMKECGSNLDPLLLEKIESSCEDIMCDPEDLGYFKWNLELFCEKKFNSSFDFPQCSCDECWKLFHWDSDFMMNCGKAFSETMLMKMRRACYNNLGDIDNLMNFVDNLEMVCKNKGEDYFKKEWCECELCWLLDDPTEPIWQECISKLPKVVQQHIRDNCLSVINDEDKLTVFKADLLYTCEEFTNLTNLTIPTCEDCTQQNVCIEFLIDASGSIDTDEFQDELDFVQAIVTAFGSNIGPMLTRVGIIQFGSGVSMELSLCAGTSEAAASAALVHTQATKLGGGTNTAGAILMMTTNFDDCCQGDKQKFGIVLTDGKANIGNLNAAIGGIPADVTMISIGVGLGADLTELLDIAQDNPANRFTVDEAADLVLVVDKIKEAIGCN